MYVPTLSIVLLMYFWQWLKQWLFTLYATIHISFYLNTLHLYRSKLIFTNNSYYGAFTSSALENTGWSNLLFSTQVKYSGLGSDVKYVYAYH